MKKNILVGLLLAALVPVAASAATADELQAQINALMAQLQSVKATSGTPATAACSYVFTKTLKKGMSDQEVMNLQKVLNMSPATQIAAAGVGSPGNETTYFGGLTKAAVIAFQNKYASAILTPAGLSVGTGLVGPATRAQLNALCMGTTATTGTTGTTAGMPTSTSAPGSTVGLQGTAGVANATFSTQGTNTTINQGQSQNVLGFKVQATDSDVNVTNLKLTLGNYDSSMAASDRLTRYASKVHIYMNGNEIGSANIADFTRNSDNTYTKSVSLSNAIVRMGSANQALFQVGFDANPNLDSNDANSTNYWTVAVSELRYNDATGVTMSTISDPGYNTIGNYVNGWSGDPIFRAFQFQKLSQSGQVTLTITSGAANPVAQNVKVSNSAQTKGVVLNEFRVKAAGSPITFNNVMFNLTGSSNIDAAINTLYIMHGSQQLGSLSLPLYINGVQVSSSTNYTFTVKLDSDYTIAQDNTDTFQIVADMNQNTGATPGSTMAFDQGDWILASLLQTGSSTVNGVFGTYTPINGTDINGDNIVIGNYSGTSVGNAQTFYTAGIQASSFTSTVSQSAGVSNGSTIVPGETYNITYHLKAFGNTYYIPKQIAVTPSAGWTVPASGSWYFLGATSTASSTGLTFHVQNAGNDLYTAGTQGVAIVLGSLSSNANMVGNYFQLPDGSDTTFNTSVTLNPVSKTSTSTITGAGIAGQYQIQLDNTAYTLDQVGGTGIVNYAMSPKQNFQSLQGYVGNY